jgi:hypothetical protein
MYLSVKAEDSFRKGGDECVNGGFTQYLNSIKTNIFSDVKGLQV